MNYWVGSLWALCTGPPSYWAAELSDLHVMSFHWGMGHGSAKVSDNTLCFQEIG